MIWLVTIGVSATLLAIIARGIVPLSTRLVLAGGWTAAAGGIAGLALSFALVAAVLFVANPDHLAALLPRAVEAASLAALAGLLWLPWFLLLYAARLREVRRHAD